MVGVQLLADAAFPARFSRRSALYRPPRQKAPVPPQQDLVHVDQVLRDFISWLDRKGKAAEGEPPAVSANRSALGLVRELAVLPSANATSAPCTPAATCCSGSQRRKPACRCQIAAGLATGNMLAIDSVDALKPESSPTCSSPSPPRLFGRPTGPRTAPSPARWWRRCRSGPHRQPQDRRATRPAGPGASRDDRGASSIRMFIGSTGCSRRSRPRSTRPPPRQCQLDGHRLIGATFSPYAPLTRAFVLYTVAEARAPCRNLRRALPLPRYRAAICPATKTACSGHLRQAHQLAKGSARERAGNVERCRRLPVTADSGGFESIDRDPEVQPHRPAARPPCRARQGRAVDRIAALALAVTTTASKRPSNAPSLWQPEADIDRIIRRAPDIGDPRRVKHEPSRQDHG